MHLKPVLTLAIALVGCAAGRSVLPGPRSPGGPRPPVPAKVSLVPLAPAFYRSDWSGLADGTRPSEFADVAAQSPPEIWLYSGDWAIARPDGHAVYAVSPYSGSYPEPLTFRRYRGSVFGPDGALGARYAIRAVACSTGGSKRFDGVGELSMQVVYQDPTHYLEVLQNDQDTKVWWADGAVPQSAAHWNDLATWPRAYSPGQWLNFGADVDLASGILTVWRDGAPLGQVEIPPSMRAVPSHMAIRATGNGEEWRSLSIRPLGSDDVN